MDQRMRRGERDLNQYREETMKRYLVRRELLALRTTDKEVG